MQERSHGQNREQRRIGTCRKVGHNTDDLIALCRIGDRKGRFLDDRCNRPKPGAHGAPYGRKSPLPANERIGFMPAISRHLSQTRPPDCIRATPNRCARRRQKIGPYGPKKYSTLKSSFTARATGTARSALRRAGRPAPPSGGRGGGSGVRPVRVAGGLACHRGSARGR